MDTIKYLRKILNESESAVSPDGKYTIAITKAIKAVPGAVKWIIPVEQEVVGDGIIIARWNMFSLYKNARDAIKDPDKNAYITNTFSEIRNVLQTDLKCRVTINDENWDHGNIKIYPTIKIVKYLPTSEDYLL